MTTLQEKLITAAKLLIEARALASANVALIRETGTDKPLERRIDDVVYGLRSNVSLTIEGIVNLAERANTELLPTEESNHEMLKKDMDWVFRRNPEFKG